MKNEKNLKKGLKSVKKAIKKAVLLKNSLKYMKSSN